MWVYLPTSACSAELAGLTLEQNSSGVSGQSVMSNGTDTPKAYSCPVCGTEDLKKLLCGTMCRPSMESRGEGVLMLFLAAFPARMFPSQGNAPESLKGNEVGFGKSLPVSWAKWDRDSSSWKMSQACLWGGGLESFSGTWPRWGLMLNGEVCQPQNLEPIFSEKGYSLLDGRLIPRPTACDGRGSGRKRVERGANNNLRDYFNFNGDWMYPPVQVSEYLMGWPVGHTALDSAATEWFHSKQPRRGK